MLTPLPKCSLAHLPTPIEEMERLSKKLVGPRIFIKRDDQTGLALGGNKVRKLEFLLAEAVAGEADTILTVGAGQSNHCRQTAAAAARVGLSCELILGGQPPNLLNSNLLLDHLFGAKIHWTDMQRRSERMQEVAEELRAAGRRPYVIPYGGSNAVGASGYVLAMDELSEQLRERRLKMDAIVFASSSGGTQAGLVVGARTNGFHGALIGIRIDKKESNSVSYESDLAELANATAKRLGLAANFAAADFTVNYDYLGGGYGVMGSLEQEAILLTARLEGILLDPVYTGRAMGALFDLIRKRVFSSQQNVLFWHTGGAPALFAYAKELSL
jgi:D-cysteine desulfhydrase